MRYSFQDRPVSKFGPPIWNCDKSHFSQLPCIRRHNSVISQPITMKFGTHTGGAAGEVCHLWLPCWPMHHGVILLAPWSYWIYSLNLNTTGLQEVSSKCNILSHMLDTSCSPAYKRAIFTISDQWYWLDFSMSPLTSHEVSSDHGHCYVYKNSALPKDGRTYRV